MDLNKQVELTLSVH